MPRIMSVIKLKQEGMNRMWKGTPGEEVNIMYSMIEEAYEHGRKLGRAQMQESARRQLTRLISDEELESYD